MSKPTTLATENKLPVIFCFINSHYNTGDVAVIALAEDGDYLASHISSSEAWAQHDIGLTSDWKHKIYRAKYPNGYELQWVNEQRVIDWDYEPLKRAYELNQAQGEME